MCARRLIGIALAGAIMCAGAVEVRAASPPNVSLGVIFPEGWTVREMAGRVAAVRRIAVRKRHADDRGLPFPIAVQLRSVHKRV
jgi:hypothetical protein